jgi:hypothetical protein
MPFAAWLNSLPVLVRSLKPQAIRLFAHRLALTAPRGLRMQATNSTLTGFPHTRIRPPWVLAPDTTRPAHGVQRH